MYCRIDRVVSRENIVAISVSGRISGAHVEMLRQVLDREARSTVLDLRDVSLIDREAVKLLALSEAKGHELRNCPRYVREWVNREIATTSIRRNPVTDDSPDTQVCLE